MRKSSLAVILAGCSLLGGIAGCSPTGEPKLSETSSELVNVIADNSGDVGNVAVGAMSGPLYITVTPRGVGDSYDLVTAVTESCANFSASPGSLPREVYKVCLGGGGEIPRVVAGEPAAATGPLPSALPCGDGYDIVDYTFPAFFAPTIAGVQSCVISITLNSGELKTITLTGNGLPPPREIDVSRSSIAFGDVRINTASTPQPVVVRNTGSAALTISSASVAGTAFSMSGPASTSIPGNSSTTYMISCAPGAATGPRSGSFTLVNDDPDEGTVTLPLSCAGVDSALTVQPSPITLQARVDEPSELAVMLVNSGGEPMNVTSVALTGDQLELVTAPSGVLQPGASMQVQLRYMARQETEISGMLSVAFDGQNRAVPVSARAKTAAMSLSPDGDVDLGAVCVGTTRDKTFSALGTGGADFVISTVAVTGEGFSLGSPAGPINVAGAGATMATLRAIAAPMVPGPMIGNLQLTTDIPGATPRTIHLSALAIADGVGAAPAEHDFGSILVDEPSSVQSISIANCSDAILSISSVAIAGVDAADFRVITEPSKSIAPSDTSSLLIEMRPRTQGTKLASLVITHGSGVTEVPLTGDGFIATVAAEHIGTYYSCSTQDGAGLGLMLGLGLTGLALRRRRRRH